MKVKVLFEDKYQVVGVMAGDECPSEDFICSNEANTLKLRQGLMEMLRYVASNGLSTMPHGWSHEGSKADGIYEFRKGTLRLFYFKGVGNQIAVCTAGALKKGRKADKKTVAKAATSRSAYFSAIETKTCEVIGDEDE